MFINYFTQYNAENPRVENIEYLRTDDFPIYRDIGNTSEQDIASISLTNPRIDINPFQLVYPEEITSTQRDQTPTQASPPSSKQELRERIVDTARQHVGGKYVWGGNGYKDKKGGFDCSGLIYYAYTQNGFDKQKMPRQSNSFEKKGKEITLDQAQPGDIIHTPGHVKMLSKKVNGQWWVVEAAGRKTGIVERPLKSTSNIISIRNYVDYLRKGGKLLPKFRY